MRVGFFLLTMLAGVFPGIAQSVAPKVPESRAAITLSFTPIVRQSAPAVVNIYATQKIAPEARGRRLDPFFEQFFGGVVPQERAQQSVGSGVIVGREGIVVTNHHVIEGMNEIRVALADRREFEAEVKLRDPRTDLAVLQIKAKEIFPALELGDSDALAVGDLVLAIGNPFGVGQTVTQGIVSALARTQVGVADYQFFIQTDAAINPGNSGGALVDMAGKVVGINTAIYSRSGGSHGIGFAIPATMVRAVVESAKAGGAVVRRPWLGASLQNVTAELAETLKLPRPSGALVASLVSGGAAELAGLKRQDVIVAVDGVEIADPDGFGYRFTTKGLGGNVPVTLLRAGEKLALTIPLMAAPEIPAREELRIRGESPFSGLKLVNVSPAVREEFALHGVESGVAVIEVAPGSAAERLEFLKGDVVLAVNGTPIATTRALEVAARSKVFLWRVTINRKGETFTSVFR